MTHLFRSLILYVIHSELSGPLSGSNQRWSLCGFNQSWSLYYIQPGLVHLVNYANAGPIVDPAVLVPLVIPATTDPISIDSVTADSISRYSHSLSQQWIQLQLVPLLNPAAAGPLIGAYVSPIDCKSVNYIFASGAVFLSHFMISAWRGWSVSRIAGRSGFWIC